MTDLYFFAYNFLREIEFTKVQERYRSLILRGLVWSSCGLSTEMEQWCVSGEYRTVNVVIFMQIFQVNNALSSSSNWPLGEFSFLLFQRCVPETELEMKMSHG